MPLLLRNIGETIPCEYEAVLEKNIKKLGESRFIMYYGEEEISYNPNFRFYMTTRLDSPVYNPEISSRVTLVNFSVKPKGLEE